MQRDANLTECGARENQPRSSELASLTFVWEFTRKSLQYGPRKLRHAVERRRMNAIRQNPAPLTAALMSARNILVVCYGNIIRSAFAARLLAQAVDNRSTVSVSSGGLGAIPGNPPPPSAVCIATRLGVDLTGHASAAVAPEAVANSDVIFVMEIRQLVEIGERFPQARAKTFLLPCLTPEGPLEIRDPVNGDESRFHECFEQIVRAVRPIAGILSMAAR